MSVLTNNALPPFASIASIVSCPKASRRFATTTRTPCAASAKQIALPIPLPPPVTIAVLSFNDS